jgi:hypothetical protein
MPVATVAFDSEWTAMHRDSLQPRLDEAQRALDTALEEACKVDVQRATTGEMIAIEETLAVAANAAKEVVSVRLRRRTSRAADAPEEADTPVPGGQDRVFDDTDGKRWHVFAVHPSVGPVRSDGVAEAFKDGWLCFESHDQRRRLAPIPESWQSLSDIALVELCRVAEPALRQF